MLSRITGLTGRILSSKFTASTLGSLTQLSVPQKSFRNFSTTDEIEKARRRVNKIMMSELRHEKENEERDESIDQFLQDKGWKLYGNKFSPKNFRVE